MVTKLFVAAALVAAGFGIAFAQDAGSEKPAGPSAGQVELPQFMAFSDLKWQKMVPDLGDASPEIAILHVDEKTKATRLFIRTPKKMHVPRHWHSANETHTMLKGSATFTCDRCGKHVTQGPGDFNYVPAKCIHQAWLSEGAVTFITVDSGWDVNWVDGPPSAKDLGVDPPPAEPASKGGAGDGN